MKKPRKQRESFNKKFPHYWTAYNKNTDQIPCREAKSLHAAVIASRRYVEDELGGSGHTKIYDHYPTALSTTVRRDENTIFTGCVWQIAESAKTIERDMREFKESLLKK